MAKKPNATSIVVDDADVQRIVDVILATDNGHASEQELATSAHTVDRSLLRRELDKSRIPKDPGDQKLRYSPVSLRVWMSVPGDQ
jgi:hypothetical protein